MRSIKHRQKTEFTTGEKKITYARQADDDADFFPMVRFLQMGQVVISKGWRCERHRHREFEWILILNGSIQTWIGAQSRLMTAGNFYFIQPGQEHEEINFNPKSEYFYLRFNLYDESGQSAYVIDPQMAGRRQWMNDKKGLWLNFFSALKQELMGLQPGWKEITETIILRHIWLLRRQYHAISTEHSARTLSNYQQTIVENAKTFIRTNFQRAIPLKELARYCCVSYYHMEHLFKRKTGISSRQYILGFRLQQAKQLLRGDPCLPIKTVSERVGMADYGYFCRLFKRETGITPSAYRHKQG